MTEPEPYSLRIYWFVRDDNGPRLFHREVASLHEARHALEAIAAFALWAEAERLVVPVDLSIGGLEWFEDGEWQEWESADGDDIWTIEPVPCKETN